MFTPHPSHVCLFFFSPFCDSPVDQSAPDRREELGQREAGAAGEVQPGESSVGAETGRGHRSTGEGTTVCVSVRVCMRERNVKDEEEIRSGCILG